MIFNIVFCTQPKRRSNHGCSWINYSANIQWQQEHGHEHIWHDYFCNDHGYNDPRCSISFCHIMDVVAHDFYSHNIFGLSSIQKCIVPIKMLTYNVATNPCDEHCKLGKSTIMQALKRICRVVKECFESKYLW